MIAPTQEYQALGELTSKYRDCTVSVSVISHTDVKLEDGTPLFYWGTRTDLGAVVGFGFQPQPGKGDLAAAWRVIYPKWQAVLFSDSKVRLLEYVSGQSGGVLVFRPVGEPVPC